ncbi:MAG: hypothetical protein WKF37_16455 [Bryobacteraceae bacterium]
MSVRFAALILIATGSVAWAQEPSVTISTPMSPPAWALLERQLLKANSKAAEHFGAKYVDERGYLLHTPRWGTLDGPDDAIETFYNWTLLHAMGGSEAMLKIYKKALEGHLKQYGEMRTKLTKLAENGAYYKEFITQSDWFHTGEGMRRSCSLAFPIRITQSSESVMKRFAGMYMGEDPKPELDPKTGIRASGPEVGPMLHKATEYDWVGDWSLALSPAPQPGRRGKLLNLMDYYPKMLAHCKEYLDSVGDHPLNLPRPIRPTHSR